MSLDCNAAANSREATPEDAADVDADADADVDAAAVVVTATWSADQAGRGQPERAGERLASNVHGVCAENAQDRRHRPAVAGCTRAMVSHELRGSLESGRHGSMQLHREVTTMCRS